MITIHKQFSKYRMLLSLLLFTFCLKTTNCLSNDTVVTLTTPQSKLVLNQTSNITISLNETNNYDVVFNCTPSSTNILKFTGIYRIIGYIYILNVAAN